MEKLTEHAANNARNWIERITETFDRLALALENDDQESAESIDNEIMEMPLSIEVGCDWIGINDALLDRMKPDRMRILLTTGGPALQVVITTNPCDCYAVERVTVEAQDWFTPWTEVRPKNAREESALRQFAERFAQFMECA